MMAYAIYYKGKKETDSQDAIFFFVDNPQTRLPKFETRAPIEPYNLWGT